MDLMMSAFIPSLSTVLAYSLACLLLVVTPGPDMTLFLSKTLTQGRMAGIVAVLGASSGIVVHALLAALGISALLAASPAAFEGLKIIGALYLLWLAVDAFRNGSALNVREGEGTHEAYGALYAKAVLVNLLNPKVVLFFVTFLPQFVSAGDPAASGKLLFLGLFFLVIATPCSIAMVWGAGWLSGTLRKIPRVMRVIDYAFASLFAGFALKLLVSRN